eukprot:GSChrysophyteH1.ASY1.ANO1.574.1 assembled CDS
MASLLTPEQQGQVRMFGEICNVSDEALCIQILQNNSFNVDMAVNNFLAGGMTSASDLAMQSDPPNAGLNSGSNASARDTSTSDEAIPARNPLFDSLLHPLKWLLRPSRALLTPSADLRRFHETFQSTYGESRPQFMDQPYPNAVRHAFRQGKFMLVYLHSPMHEDTDEFCKRTLCKPNVIRELDSKLLCWAGSVQASEAYSLSIQLQAHAYPFMALLVARSEREVMIADKIQGFIDEQSLLRRLRRKLAAFQSHLSQIQQQQQQRDEAVSLRAEQDREFRESERMDRQRREEREKQRIEAAERAQNEGRRIAAEAEAAQNILKQKKESLDSEPNAAPHVTALRVQLPSGQKLNRRFLKSDTVETLRNWLDVYFAENDSISIANYTLCTSFPKKEVTELTASLESLGLHPRGMLYVQDLDA